MSPDRDGIVLDRVVTLRRRVPSGALDEHGDPAGYDVMDRHVWAALEEAGQDFEVTERGGVVTTEEAYIVRWDASLAGELGKLYVVAGGKQLRVDRVSEHGERRRYLRLTVATRS